MPLLTKLPFSALQKTEDWRFGQIYSFLDYNLRKLKLYKNVTFQQTFLKYSDLRGSVATTGSRYLYYGATYLLKCFSEEIGFTTDLKACFRGTYKQILSIAFYLILEDDNLLYRFEKWHLTHKHMKV